MADENIEDETPDALRLGLPKSRAIRLKGYKKRKLAQVLGRLPDRGVLRLEVAADRVGVLLGRWLRQLRLWCRRHRLLGLLGRSCGRAQDAGQARGEGPFAARRPRGCRLWLGRREAWCETLPAGLLVLAVMLRAALVASPA